MAHSHAPPTPLGIAPPVVPLAGPLYMGLIGISWVLVAAFLLDRGSILLADYWFFGSVGFESVFRTNLRMGALLYSIAFVVGAGGITAAAYTNPVGRQARRVAIHLGLMAGLVGGYFLCLRYADFLMVIGGSRFGQEDPVFGKDVGFYVFTLPAMWTTLFWALTAVGMGFVFAVVYAYLGRPREVDPELSSLTRTLGPVGTPLTALALVILSGLGATAVWLLRYDVLIQDNSDSGIFTGASYIDVTGLFSTINYYSLTALVVFGVGVAVTYLLVGLRRVLEGRPLAGWRRRARLVGIGVLALVGIDFAFRVGVLVRDVVFVSPNEPVVQLDYIRQHIDATRAAYGLEDLETVRFIPNDSESPPPDVEGMLASATLRNAPLWPGFVSRLERLIDVQHRNRIALTAGDATVYGPTLEIFRQQQKLRPYYDFLDVDAVRYVVDGETRMFASAVRELPLIEPKPWLAWWGQRFVLFTHGHGLVATGAGDVTPNGDPRYSIHNIPSETVLPVLDLANPAVYYGEGAQSLAYSNVRGMMEFDFPTDEGRAEVVLGADVNAGVHIDSFLKRVVFGWHSGQFFDIVFSRLIVDETRVHYYRTPVERVARLAPFLFLDSDPYAVAIDGGILWLVNGMTTTDRYPNSQLERLGDKSDERGPLPRPWVETNYARDAVKITVDAYTGQLRLYRISDDPILDTWARIYPDLFVPETEMPAAVRDHLQYPVQLFHLQFDNIYNLYHMKDPMTFFNMEDMWDDADEVLGPVLDEGAAITFSIEPYHWMAETGGALPRGQGDRSQFALSMAFTPESAQNLRAIPTVYQDGEDYGRIVVPQIPKGLYVMGPEQADAAIDQSPEISQQFAWWNRRGMEVIRGHTSTLIIGNELLYVEPIFLRSRQNPVPQLKQVCVVLRDVVSMKSTLEEALRDAAAKIASTATPAG